MQQIIIAVSLYLAIVMVLIWLVMLAKKWLIPAGDVSILVNDQKQLSSPRGGKLLGALSQQGIFVASACGGGGTCAQCLVKVKEGGGAILATERTHINRREVLGHWTSAEAADFAATALTALAPLLSTPSDLETTISELKEQAFQS